MFSACGTGPSSPGRCGWETRAGLLPLTLGVGRRPLAQPPCQLAQRLAPRPRHSGAPELPGLGRVWALREPQTPKTHHKVKSELSTELARADCKGGRQRRGPSGSLGGRSVGSRRSLELGGQEGLGDHHRHQGPQSLGKAPEAPRRPRVLRGSVHGLQPHLRGQGICGGAGGRERQSREGQGKRVAIPRSPRSGLR